MKAIKYNKIIKILTVLALIICLLTIAMAGYAYTSGKDLEKNLLRLHILANSDSKEDQALKLQVRDRVIEFIKVKYGSVKNKDEMMSLISKDIDGINKYVEEYIKSQQKSFEVKTELSKVNFPTKDYGLFKIPPGIYDSLRIIIGSGEGKNWWCILFPPLCFADSATSNPESIKNKEDAEKMLKDKLTKEEYTIISQSKTNNNGVKFKFKIVEVFQDSKVKLSMVKNGIF